MRVIDPPLTPDTAARLANSGNGVVNVLAYPYRIKYDGSTYDEDAFRAAVATGKAVYMPGEGVVGCRTPVALNNPNQKIFTDCELGGGESLVALLTPNDNEIFQVSAPGVTLKGLLLTSTLTTNTKDAIKSMGGADFLTVDRCYFNGIGATSATGGGLQTHASDIVTTVKDCVFNHSYAIANNADFHSHRNFYWANTKPFGLKAVGTATNLLSESDNFVPPLRSVSGAKAGLWINGSALCPRIISPYFDGNPGLDTGVGALIENGVIGTSIIGAIANRCSGSPIILDSIIGAIVQAGTFTNNNKSNGSTLGSVASPDILIRQTYGQACENIIIRGNSLIQTAAVNPTYLAAAIELATGVARHEIRIEDNAIYQPGAGGGYNDVEINLVDGAFASLAEGSLRGNKGTRSVYQLSGTLALAADDTYGVTSYSPALAYPPRADQIRVRSDAALAVRVQLLDRTATLLGLAAAPGGAIHLYWDVSL